MHDRLLYADSARIRVRRTHSWFCIVNFTEAAAIMLPAQVAQVCRQFDQLMTHPTSDATTWGCINITRPPKEVNQLMRLTMWLVQRAQGGHPSVTSYALTIHITRGALDDLLGIWHTAHVCRLYPGSVG